jgi:hypothetical protein
MIRLSDLIIDFKSGSKPLVLKSSQKLQTEISPELKEKTNKKESFMDYYRSIEKKTKSNLLEKYIKMRR